MSCFRAFLAGSMGLAALGCGESRGPTGFSGGPDGTEIDWPELGTGTMTGAGSSTDRWQKAEVTRNGVNYLLMANGWGPKFESQAISWNGTSFKVESMLGTTGENYEPASYPTVFCGKYSDSISGACGLPATLASLTSLRTGWSWRANGNDGEYNAAYDIWMGNESGALTAYLMVWYRDPFGQQPSGGTTHSGVTVANVTGKWNIWAGEQFGHPYVAYTRAEGADTLELEFDVLDFVRDAQARGVNLPGSHVNGVAIGFELWEGPVTNLETLDFFVHAQ